MRIGGGWNKVDTNNKEYISVSFDKALKPLIIDDTKVVALFPNDRKETADQPDWHVCMDIKKPKEAEPAKAETANDFIF